jgi:non-ribosomal peptide synthetase component F
MSKENGPKNWIVMTGQPVDSTDGGGFEFFGPFTEGEAAQVREAKLRDDVAPGSWVAMAIQLLHHPIMGPRPS